MSSGRRLIFQKYIGMNKFKRSLDKKLDSLHGKSDSLYSKPEKTSVLPPVEIKQAARVNRSYFRRRNLPSEP